jgi:hypothetical protein
MVWTAYILAEPYWNDIFEPFHQPLLCSTNLLSRLSSLVQAGFIVPTSREHGQKKNGQAPRASYLHMKLVTVTTAGDVAVRDSHASADYRHLSLSPESPVQAHKVNTC